MSMKRVNSASTVQLEKEQCGPVLSGGGAKIATDLEMIEAS